MDSFAETVQRTIGAPLQCGDLKTLQVNLGLNCNQACAHCHQEASPSRGETMAWPLMEQAARVAWEADCALVDITGGAPELHPDLRRFVRALKGICAVQVRTNLTALLEPGQDGLPEFFRDAGVKLVASLPCYTEANVRAQRGPGVFEQSIEALRVLNRLGYGEDSPAGAGADALTLDLVYNPGGPFLPGCQADLERDYKRELGARFGVSFNRLLAFANMPIGRFRTTLAQQGELERYERLLRGSFNPRTVAGLMCRHQVCVGWDGGLYDCDFNLALGRRVNHGAPSHLRGFDAAAVRDRTVETGEHCFGCTAGAGSSCGGSLA